MYRNARVYVADVLSQIVVEATVFTADWKKEAVPQANSYRVTVMGVGEDDERRWLRDALIALAETL